MKLEVSKKTFFAIFGAILFVVALIAATAYSSTGTGGTPATFGHSVDELDWSKTITANLAVNGNITAKNVSAASVCVNGDCRTSWPSFSYTDPTVYQVSCGTGDSGLNWPFCCRIKTTDGSTDCKIMASTGLSASWTSATSPFSATTAGTYSLACSGGNNNGNRPWCCRVNAVTGATDCKRPADTTLSSWTSISDPW